MCTNYDECGGCSCHLFAPCSHCTDDHDKAFAEFVLEAYEFGDIRDEVPNFTVIPVGPNKDIQLSKYWGLVFERGRSKIILPVMFLSKVTKAMVLEGGLAQLSLDQIGHLTEFYQPRKVTEGQHEWKRFTGGKSNPQQIPRPTPIDPDGPPAGYFISDWYAADYEMREREYWKDSRGFALSRAISRLGQPASLHEELRTGIDLIPHT